MNVMNIEEAYASSMNIDTYDPYRSIYKTNTRPMTDQTNKFFYKTKEKHDQTIKDHLT